MTKLKMESKDMTQYNIEQIAQMFPQVITEVADPSGAKDEEGKPILKKAIDFEKLKLVLSAGSGDYVVADDEREHYEFTWVGKRQSMIDAATPIRKTLRPCPEESKNWDSTENLYIEGDNLEVLKLLQESYLGKVKVVYIDPPYNTGNDIIYKNDYSISQQEYDNNSNYDDDGYIVFSNTETNGRFHSDWLSMMYPRIKLASNLLAEDGFFLIAIDHNEIFNLGEVCDEIFGRKNRIGVIAIVHKPEGRNQAKFIGASHEYMLMYAKNEQIGRLQKVALDDNQANLFSNFDDKGSYRLKNFIRLSDGKYSLRENKPTFWYPIYVSHDLSKMDITQFNESICVYPITDTGIERTWKTTKETFLNRYKEGSFETKKENDRVIIYEKLREDQVIKTHWIDKKYHGFHFGTKVLDELLDVKTFDFPKSLYLMKDIYKLCTNKNDIILDFFSGSGTSAHSIMLLNSEDNGTRKYIMAQIPAKCNAGSNASEAGYENICEIGKERIRRAGEKVDKERIDRINKEAQKDGVVADIAALDTGFRVFKTDSTNMKDVYYAAGDISQATLFDMVSNIKDDRSDIDLLYGCLLDWGVPLSQPHRSEEIDGSTVHFVNDTNLIACFDNKVTEQTVREIAKLKPLRALFRDHSFEGSANKINVYEIFKSISPNTFVKVI